MTFYYPTYNDTYNIIKRNLDTASICRTREDAIYSFTKLAENNSDKIAIDFETRGFIPSSENLHGIGLYDGVNKFYILWNSDTEEIICNSIREFNNKVTWLCHNAKFEYKWINDVLGIKLNFIEDTMLAYYALAQDKSLKLSSLAVKYLNKFPYTFESLIQVHFVCLSLKSVDNGLMEYKEQIECDCCNGIGKVAGKTLKYPKTKFNIRPHEDIWLIEEYQKIKGKRKKVPVIIESVYNEKDLYKEKKCDKCKGTGLMSVTKQAYGVDLVPLKYLADYCVEDCIETYMLWEYFSTNHNYDYAWNIYKIEIEALKYIICMDNEGCKIDTEKMTTLDNKITKELSAIEYLWDLQYPDTAITSHHQVKKLLFEELSLLERCNEEILKLLNKTSTNTVSSSSDNLKLLAYLEPDTIELKLRHGKLFKLQNTYTSKLKESEIIHTAFNQALTATGRLSSSYNNFYPQSTNLQNIPNADKSLEGKLIRQCFIAKRKNYKILCLDYSQFELRILAYYGVKFLQNHFLENLFIKEKDVHTVVTCIMFNIDYENFDKENPEHKRLRTISKTINFGIVYGMNYPKLAMMLGLPLEEAKRLFNLHKENLSGIWDIIYYLQFKAVVYGYSETLFSRRRFYNFETHKLKDLYQDYSLMKNYKFWYHKICSSRISPNDGEQLRQASNAPIQGTNADAVKLVLGKLYQELDIENNTEIFPLLQIHDELVFEVLEDKAEYYKKLISNIMASAINLGNIPVKVSGDIADSWGNAK